MMMLASHYNDIKVQLERQGSCKHLDTQCADPETLRGGGGGGGEANSLIN